MNTGRARNPLVCKRSPRSDFRCSRSAGCYWTKFESWRYAAQVSAPTLVLAAEYDEVIPRANIELLYKPLPRSLTTLIVVRDAGHNTISDTTE